MNTQPLLFSEPSIAETGVWCSLADGIDPAEWAYLCRYLGSLRPDQFQRAKEKLAPASLDRSAKSLGSPDSLFSRLKRVFCFDQAEFSHLPLVCTEMDTINR